LPDAVFGQALDALVIACTDVVLVHQTEVLLAKRCRYPIQDWWVIGGRMVPGESPQKTAQRKVQEEAGVALSEARFHFVGVYSTFFVPRLQPVAEHGLHSINLTYWVELTPEERSRLHLIASEYTDWHWFAWAEVLKILNTNTPNHRPLLRVLADVCQQHSTALDSK
jgi:ADP-ribose pyrophosphatase YjhB (NUDIX family)